MRGRLALMDSIQPAGVLTLMPRPLSSHTSSSGSGRPWYAHQDAVFIAPTAVEWFADASPKLATTRQSRGHGVSSPSLAARATENARPTARGRCEAMVEVCGMTCSSG